MANKLSPEGKILLNILRNDLTELKNNLIEAITKQIKEDIVDNIVENTKKEVIEMMSTEFTNF